MTPIKINNPIDGTLKFQFTQLESALSIDFAAATAIQIVKYFCSPTVRQTCSRGKQTNSQPETESLHATWRSVAAVVLIYQCSWLMAELTSFNLETNLFNLIER